jgi:hypothetical protein
MGVECSVFSTVTLSHALRASLCGVDDVSFPCSPAVTFLLTDYMQTSKAPRAFSARRSLTVRVTL